MKNEFGGFEVEKKELSFEDFINRQNNFYVHFLPDGYNWLESIYKSKPYYKKFAEENVGLSSQMQEKFSELLSFIKKEKKPPIGSPYEKIVGNSHMKEVLTNTELPYIRDLYGAYLIMRKYVDNDDELFK